MNFKTIEYLVNISNLTKVVQTVLAYLSIINQLGKIFGRLEKCENKKLRRDRKVGG